MGKAGNPDVQPGVDIVIGPGTEIIAGEGRILTAGGFDAHIHYICPQQVEDALHSGLTTMLGGGTGPAHGTLATTCTPGPWHIARMLQAADAFPMNSCLRRQGQRLAAGGARGADPRRRLRPEAARRRIEDAPDAMAGCHIGAFHTLDLPEEREPIPRHRPKASLSREDGAPGENRERSAQIAAAADCAWIGRHLGRVDRQRALAGGR